MMECKKALVETNGDLKAAEELMRIKSGAKASKAASRVTAEGVIGSYLAADGKTSALVEVNCETDFVAKNDDFMAFAKNVAQTVAQKTPADSAALLALPIVNGSESIEETRKALVMKLGENITVRRFVCYATPRANWQPICMATRSGCWLISPMATKLWARTWRCISPRASRNLSIHRA
jgi:elongation factor Ts